MRKFLTIADNSENIPRIISCFSEKRFCCSKEVFVDSVPKWCNQYSPGGSGNWLSKYLIFPLIIPSYCFCSRYFFIPGSENSQKCIQSFLLLWDWFMSCDERILEIIGNCLKLGDFHEWSDSMWLDVKKVVEIFGCFLFEHLCTEWSSCDHSLPDHPFQVQILCDTIWLFWWNFLDLVIKFFKLSW